jgi:hypothetical protein
LAVFLCGLWGLRSAWDYVQAIPTGDIVGLDPIDSGLITEGLEKTKSWHNTLSWWRGPWVAWIDEGNGQGHGVKFYRPLSSLVWWIEFQAFGRQGLAAFTIVHALSHLLVLSMALLFFRELFGLRVAALSLGIFALHLAGILFYLPSPRAALVQWKDGPDLWCSMAYLASLWCFLKFTRGGGTGWLSGSVGGFVMAICFKEMAYTLPLILLLLLWNEGKLSSHWRFAVPFCLVAAAAFGFRWWALEGFGFRFGSNGSWPSRWFMDCVGGMAGANLSRGDGLPLALSCAATALVIRLRPHRLGLPSARAWPLWLMAAFFIYALTEFAYSTNPGDAFWRLFLFETDNNSVWRMMLYTLALLLLLTRFVVRRPRVQMFAYGWVVLTYLPLMTAPITHHAHYFVGFGWSIWMAYSLLDVLDIANTINQA